MNSNYLKNILSNRNISIYKLAKLSDISDGRLNQIINNKTKKPQISTVVKIAKALDLNEHEFAELCDYKFNKQSCIPLDIKDENTKSHGGNPLYGEWITGTCPRCKQDVQLGMNYCPNCGLKLLWENVENEKE